MIIDASIWLPNIDEDDGDEYQGEILIDVSDDEEVNLILRIDGHVKANATVDRFAAGVLVGQLAHAASEAVKT